jgi:hypothetical protein
MSEIPQSTPQSFNSSPTVDASIRHGTLVPASTSYEPDIVIDTSTSVVHLYPASSQVFSSPVFNDISIHQVSSRIAEEQLDTFRRAFIPTFPFVYIPNTLSASELRHQKPFLWLVVMCLSTKQVSQQFVIEETIWRIISRRIVVEHLATLDLLLGVVCFATWYVTLITIQSSVMEHLY